MIRRLRSFLRCLPLLVGTVACWQLLFPALDLPSERTFGALPPVLRATGVLLLAACCCLLAGGRTRWKITRTDLLAGLLFAVVTASRLLVPGAAAGVRYDEFLQAAMLCVSLRILFQAERRLQTVLFVLLCVAGACEAWTGLRQIYGWAPSNHGLFRVTGTLFNPGPYGGFLACVLVCAGAWLVRRYRTVARILHGAGSGRMLRIAVFVPCAAAACACVLAGIVLPATLSRGALAAVLVSGGVLLFRECGVAARLRLAWASHRVPTALLAGAAVLLLGVAAQATYRLKRPSADGRLLMWKIDARILLRHPGCGVGLGNFAGAFGDEQARYFASGEGDEAEMAVAGCPEQGFNDFLQFGAETGAVGFFLLLLLTGTAVRDGLRRRQPFGYGVLTAALFACVSYPWSVLPLRLLFVLLLAANGSGPGRTVPRRGRWLLLLLPAVGLALWPGLYRRVSERADAHREWREVRVWLDAGRYDYLIEDGKRLLPRLQGDFRFLYEYGYALHRTGDHAGSNRVLRIGMGISSDPLFRVIAGKNYEALGDLPAAEAAYRQAHAMLPDRIYPRYLLARLYRSSGRTALFRETAGRAVRHTPKIESVQTREMQEELRRMLDSLPENHGNGR